MTEVSCEALVRDLKGLFELPEPLDSNAYLNSLQNELPPLLKDVNLRTRECIISQNEAHHAIIQ